MKRRWTLLVCTMMIISYAEHLNACDVCGCAVSGYQFGILPQFQKHFTGFRYSYKNFASVHPPLFSTDKESVSREYFHTTDLWGRYVLGNRIQLFGFIPYHIIVKNENDVSLTQKGLGDITLIGMYAIINQKKSDDGRWMHHFQLGGGIKLPTGSSDYYTVENEWIAGIQKGSGTTDLLINANYLMRFDNFGISAETSWRFNGLNTKQNFRYGNRLTSGLRGFYVVHSGDKSIMPSLGCTLEHSSLDYHEGTKVDLSGGNALFGHIGLDYFSRRFSAGLSIQPAISQNVAAGNLTSGTRVSAQFAVLF